MRPYGEWILARPINSEHFEIIAIGDDVLDLSEGDVVFIQQYITDDKVSYIRRSDVIAVLTEA